jgi:hypothetical protein
MAGPAFSLDELERRYDGPIPEPERLAWRHGSAERARWLAARAQMDFFRSRIDRQAEIIRARRWAGTATPDLAQDLMLYRRQWRQWRREEARLRVAMGTE